MKKIIAVLTLVILAFFAGRLAGIRHTIEDAIMWDDSTGIYLLLDGNIYEHMKGE